MLILALATSAGSPPHTWGIRRHSTVGRPCWRITPTYMGNTLFFALLSDIHRDHPHIHGEYSTDLFNQRDILGSPPHTWGILIKRQIIRKAVWITPTYMGNTKWSVNMYETAADHPHIHGEYKVQLAIYTLKSGSPPHTWGIRAGQQVAIVARRITPTYMGNTTRQVFRRCK